MVLKVYLKIHLIVLFYVTELMQPYALQSFQTYVLVNNNLCGKLFSLLELPTIFK